LTLSLFIESATPKRSGSGALYAVVAPTGGGFGKMKD
jgi:hypothetical protein